MNHEATPTSHPLFTTRLEARSYTPVVMWRRDISYIKEEIEYSWFCIASDLGIAIIADILNRGYKNTLLTIVVLIFYAGPELVEACVILNVEEGHVCTLNMVHNDYNINYVHILVYCIFSLILCVTLH